MTAILPPCYLLALCFATAAIHFCQPSLSVAAGRVRLNHFPQSFGGFGLAFDLLFAFPGIAYPQPSDNSESAGAVLPVSSVNVEGCIVIL